MSVKTVISLIILLLFVFSVNAEAQNKSKNTLSTNVLLDALGLYNLTIGRSLKDGRQELQISAGLAFANEESDAWLGGASDYYYNLDGALGGIVGFRHYLLRAHKGLFIQGQLKLFNFNWRHRQANVNRWTESNALFIKPSAHAGYKLRILRTGLYIAAFAGFEYQGGEWISEEGIPLRNEEGLEELGGGITTDFGLILGYNF